MTSPNYENLLKQYANMLKDEPKLSVKDFCVLVGVPYATAKRYITKKKAKALDDGAMVRTAIDSGAEIEQRQATGKNRHNWHLLLKEYLTLAIANPKYSVSKFAKEKGVNPATMRRQFKDMRSLKQFDHLYDLYDEQKAKIAVVNSTRRSAESGEIVDSSKGRNARAKTRLDGVLKNRTQKSHQNADVRSGNRTQMVEVSEDAISSLKIAAPLLHDAYFATARVSERVLDAVAQVDPLSVSPELTLARTNLLTLYADYHTKIYELERMKEAGEALKDSEGEDMDIDSAIDRVRYGFTPRIREAEMSITQMSKLENKRYIDIRKQEHAELMTPAVLPAQQQAIVMQMLTDRTKKNWSAFETCQNIEMLGAEPPATLLHEMKLELASIEPEVDDSGVDEEVLDAEFGLYVEEHAEQVESWVDDRRQEVASQIQSAEDIENGITPEVPISQIQESAETQEAYDELSESDSELFSLDAFEVLGGEENQERTE